MRTKYRNLLKRGLALFLCLVMMMGTFPSAYATGDTTDPTAGETVFSQTENVGGELSGEDNSAQTPLSGTTDGSDTEGGDTDPEGTPAPAAAGDPEETPTPTDAPEVTETPAPTDAPEVTETPAPTDAPEVTETPAPTEEPEVTETPAPTEEPVVTTLTPTLTVTGDDENDGVAREDDTTVSFTAKPSYTLAAGESLPEGATVGYSYLWQYAERQFTNNWWLGTTEQELEEADWKNCQVSEEDKEPGTKYFDDYGKGAAVYENLTGDAGENIGQKLTINLPDGMSARKELANLAIRCKVEMTIMAEDGETVLATVRDALYPRKNMNFAASLTSCVLTVEDTGSITDLVNAEDVLTLKAVPSLSVAVEGASYSYTWQFKDSRGRWRAVNYSSSPIKTATVSSDETGGILLFPLPASIADREKLQGLELLCKVTVNASETISGSPYTIYFNPVTVDEGLLKYTLSVTSDNSGATATAGDVPLRFKVSPKLSGVAADFSGYSYSWEYYRADDPNTEETNEEGWVSVSAEGSPFQRATVSTGKESVLTMSLPDDLEERAALRGQKLCCKVSVSGYEADPAEVYGEEATVVIPDRLLSSCTLTVEPDSGNNSAVGYPGQLLRWTYHATVGGAKPEDAILVYKWSFNGEALENVAAFNGFEYVTDEAGRNIGVIFAGTSNTETLKALDGGKIKCEIELYENNERYQNGDKTHGFTESFEDTITVDPTIINSYEKAAWLTDAWLNVVTDVKSDAIMNVGDQAIVEMIFDLGYTKNLTTDQQMQEGRYVANMDDSYDPYVLKYNWEYRENENQPWKTLDTLRARLEDNSCIEIVQFYDGTEETRANIGKTGFTVTINENTSYADRNLLSGMQFRCTASALVRADEPDPEDNNNTLETLWGVVSASVPDSQVLTIIISPKLLHSQVSNTRRITGFLTKAAADQWLSDPASVNLADPNNLYDSAKSYDVKYFEDGVREDRATADFPTSIVAVYEYQSEVPGDLNAVATNTAAVEIPVPWRFVVQNGRQYDLGASKAEYRYDAVLADIIPQWNAEALQEYINTHDPNDLDYDEDAAVKWVVAAGLNGRFPHVKVCWNTELEALASNADYVKYNNKYGSSGNADETAKVAALAGAPINPSQKDTLSDWFFNPSQFPGLTGQNEPMSEEDQLQWLQEHYTTVKVTMDDVKSDLSDPTPIVKELPISWKKVEINEYDVDSQSMTTRWLGDAATDVIQGINAAAAKWGWQATIDAVESGEYTASATLRNTPVEANIYWSNVIDGIVGAVLTNSTTADKVTYKILTDAAGVDSNIMPYLRVEYKDANGGTNIQAVVPIDKTSWKVVDGSFCEADATASRGYAWTDAQKNASYTSALVPSGAKAGYLTLEPMLTGNYTFTENADTTEAQVAYQWGTIITELMKSDGASPYDPLMAAKTPIQVLPQISGNDQTQAQWAKISAKFSKSFKTTIMDVSKTSGFRESTAAATWTKPNYNESTPAGKIQPGVKIDNYASGIVFGEDFLRDLGSRDIYGEASWKIAVPSATSGSSSFIKWNSNSGQPYVSGANGQMTVYSDRPWECYYSTNTTGAVRQQTANFAPAAQDTWQNSANNDGVKYMVTTTSRGGGAYVEWSVTFRNDSTGTRYVGLSYGSDVMIHSNDRAPLTKTETGFKMEEAQGDNCQFNINCTTATAGISVSADTRWIGVYSSRQHWTEAGGNYVSGIDSGLTFSWIPANHPIQPGEEVTFTCQFGIGKMSDPPRIVPHYDSGSGRSTDVTMSGNKLNVSAWLAGDNKYPMTLYYILDEGLPTQQSEASVGGKQTPGGVVTNAVFSGWNDTQKTNYFRTGTDGHFKQFTGEIEKPRDWVAGEYHTITLFGLSDAGLMTDSVKFPLYVEESEDGEEIFVPPTVATVVFNRGSGGGTAPASQTAHLREPISLPKSTGMTPPSGQKFVGWDYNKLNDDGTRSVVTYPAETYFYVQENPTTLTAKWIPTSQTMYQVETYMQNASGDYEQGETTIAIADAGSGNIVYTPAVIKGYTVNTGKSTLSIPRTDGSIVKVYYDLNKYNIVYNVNDTPTTAPDGSVNPYYVFKTVSVPYGANVSGIPTAAQLNAGKNNNFFTFIGWFTKPDVNDRGDLIDTDTVVNEASMGSADPGSELNAYSHWRPNGSAQINFDYGYVNHAQGASRTDRVKLNPVESSTGKYGYSSVASRTPRTPSAWKDTSGKVFTFKEWRIVDSSVADSSQWQVYTKDTVLPNYENYTVRAFWEESYTVSRSTQGNGRVWDINDPADGEKSYAPGDSVDIRWRADAGNYVQHVYIDNVLSDELIRNGGWHLDDIGGMNHSVYVVFGEGDGDSGLEEETTYNITATPEGGVAFTAPPRGGTYKASFGENYTVRWNVSPGYRIASVTVNGLPMDVSEESEIVRNNEYQFNDIHTDQEIVVTAVRTDGSTSGGSVLNRGPYTISTKIAKGTSITPSPVVPYGGSSTITWRLPFGFVVDRIYVNNVELHDLPTDNSYTFKNVAMNSSIQVICRPDENIAEDSIYVSTTIDDGGTITPTTPVGLLSRGDNHTVTWSVDPGYYVFGVSIDNVLQKTESGANKIFYSHTFTNIQEPHDVVVAVRKIPAGENQTFTVSTSMVNGGSIVSPGAVASGSDVTVTWTMAANHHVTGVYLDNQLVADYDMTAKPNSYTITNLTANRSLRVECARDEAEEVPEGSYTVTTSINLGTADNQKIVVGGEPCTVNWTPPAGYHLESITVNGTAVTGVTGNSYTIPSVTENTNVAVRVVKDDNFYTLNTSIVNGGTISNSGDYATNMSAVVSWTVAPGFRVTKVTLDGVEINGISGTSYTFTPPSDAKGKTYTIEVVCAPELYYNVRTVGTGTAELTPDTMNILLGQDHTVTWKAADGYKFVSASVDDLAITPVENDGVYSYTFDGDVPTAGKTYILKVKCQPLQAYTITTGRNTGGWIDPSKTILETDEQQTYTVTWGANAGYVVKSVTLNDTVYTGTNYVFDFANGRNDKLVVEFAPKSYYTVAVTGNNASITSGSGTYLIDQDATVSWTAPEGFVLQSFTVDGVDCKNDINADGLSYTFNHNTPLTSGHVYNVVVTYVADGTGGGDEPVEDKYYYIDTDGAFTASITADGQAKLGEDYSVSWKVASGHVLQSVTVDGTVLSASDYSRAADGTYTYVVSGAGRNENDTVTVKVVCQRDNSGGEAVTPYSVYGRSNDENLGTVTPANVTLREAGTSTTVRWSAKFGCHVVKVTESEYSTTAPDNRINSRELSAAEAALGQITFNYDTHKDLVYDVEFARDPQYTVSVATAGNVGEGCGVTANGGTAPVVLATAGQKCDVTWVTASGYTISAVEVLKNGTVTETLTAAEVAAGSKTFNYEDLTGNITVRVTYSKDAAAASYSVHASCNNTGWGSVSPAVKTLTAAGSTCDVTWAANPGYRVRSVVVSDYPSGSNARTLSASERNAGVYTFKYDDGKDINIYVSFEALTPYTVTVNKVGGGAASSVSGGGTMNIAGQTSMVTWSAGAGYTVESVVIADPDGGNSVTLSAAEAANNSYLFKYDEMNSDRVVTVTYTTVEGGSAVASVVTSVNDSSMGWITPSADLYTEGSTYRVNWGANAGYQVVGVVIDGVSQSLPLPTDYLFGYDEHKDDGAPTEIKVNFAALDPYTITTRKIAGGANSTVRDGTTLTRHGESYAVTWIADAGFEVDSIVITDSITGEEIVRYDAGDPTAAAAIAAGKYTFNYDDVMFSAHPDVTLTVTFKTSAHSSEAVPFSVTTAVNDPAMGSIDPSTTLRTPGSEYVVTWSANPGYELDKVYVNDAEYNGASYTFRYDDGQDATVRAEFKEIPKYTLTTVKMGTFGPGCTVSDSVVLERGQSTTVTWHADAGYSVKSIAMTLPNGTERLELTAAQIAAGSYTISYADMNASNRRFVVTFQKDESTTPGGDDPTPYSVTTSVNDSSMGSVSPSKTLRAAGETYEITWTANPGYRVKLVTVDGRVHNFNLNSSYTFRYDDYIDSVVKVTFAPIEKYTVTAAKVGGGAASTVSPATGELSKSGDSHTVTWTAGEGYTVKSVVVTNDKGRVLATATAAEIATGAYTINYDDMTSDQTVTVTFDKEASAQVYSINTGVNDSTMGWVDPSVTLTAAGSQAVIDWAANSGYRVKYVTLANPDGTGATRLTDSEGKPATSYTFKFDDLKDRALTVYFEAIPSYTVTAAKVGGGSVSAVLPATGTLSQPGEEHTVTWMADTGYLTEKVQIFRPNNSVLKTLTAAEVAAGSYTFKYAEMSSDLRIEVTFIKDIPYAVSVGTVGSGTVKIDGDAAVSTKSLNGAGQTAKVSWQAAEGWHFDSLTVNGEASEPDASGEYIFQYDSHRDERVVVTFVANEAKTAKAVLAGAYGLSTISPASTSMNKSGDNVTVTWTIDSMYEITGAVITNDDGTVVKTLTAEEYAAGSYSFAYDTMSGNETLTITVAKKVTGGETPVTPYTITTGVNDSSMGTITAGSTLTSGSYTVTWSANEGYHVKSVTHKVGDAVQDPAPASPYTFSYDTAKANDRDESIYVEFERNAGYAVNVNVTGSGNAAPATVLHKGTYIVWWKPNSDAELDSVSITNYDGNSGTRVLTAADWQTAVPGDPTGLGTGTQYFVFDYEKMNGNATIDISFKDKGYYYIVVSGQNVQSISASPDKIECSNPRDSVISWTPVSGAVFQSLTVDGSPVTLPEGAESYTVAALTAQAAGTTVKVNVVYTLPEPDPETYRINITKVGSGNADGAGVITSAEGSREVTWSPASGWHVASVSVDGVMLPDVLANSGSYTVNYSDFSETKTHTDFVITFESDDLPTPPPTADGHTLSTTYEGSGTVGDGITLTEENGNYVHTVTWTAADGWRVKSAELYDTADMSAPIQILPATGEDAKYDFSYLNPGKNVTLKVVFEKDEVKQFNITVITDPGGVLASAASATLSTAGESFEAQWGADSGYHVTDVLLNNVSIPDPDSGSYVFTYNDMLLSGMPTDNLLEIKLAPDEAVRSKYLISTKLTPGAAGSISSSAIVEEGDSHTVTWSVGTGYTFKKVTLDGTEVTPSFDSSSGEYSYVLSEVSANHSVVVTCEQTGGIGGGDTDEFFDIVTGVSNGTISDGKTTRSIHKGEDYSLSWSPNPGFFIESVTVDGEAKGAITSYTFTDIREDHTIEVVCKSLAESNLYYVNVSVVDETVLDGNGKPTPSGGAVTNGNREVTVGSDHTVTWAALSGYQISKVSVSTNGGEAQVITSGESGGTYVVTGAAKDDHINVEITVKPKDEGVYYDIVISSMNASITGNTRVKEGESTTISWEPEFGYAVKSIIIDDSTRPITLESYTFDNVTANHSVTVICERLDTEKEYVITTHITDGGSITPPVTVRTAEEKESQTISWTPAADFVVDRVKIDGVIRSDLVTAGSYTFTDIEDNHSVDVECKILEIASFTITATNDNGSISAEPAVVTSGESSTVTWKPADGFKLDSVTVDGISLDRSDYNRNEDGTYSYTFSNVTSNHSIEVSCVLEDSNANYAVSTAINNGSITPSFTVAKSDTAAKSVSWTVDDGYRVVRVLVDGAERADLKTETSVDLGAVTQNRTVSVETEAIPSFTIKTDGVNVAAITPTGSVREGSDHSVSWTPADNMDLQSITVDGRAKGLSDCTANEDGTYSYTFNDVREGHEIRVVYSPKVTINEYTINTRISDGGTITPAATLAEGSNKRVDWTAPAGYTVKTVKIDGIEYPELKTAGSYTFIGIMADHTVEVVCELVPVAKQYTITASNNGGPITVEHATVSEGGSCTVTWSGTEGLVFKSVSVDGAALGEAEYTVLGDGTMSYTFSNVTADHHVSVIYERDPNTPVDPETETFYILTSIDNGTITPTVTVSTAEEKVMQTISWTVAEGYRITGVTIDGVAIADFDSAAGTADFPNITADHSVDVSCEKIPAYTVRTDAMNVKNITPTTPDIREGDSFTVTWTPADGMVLKRVLIDNVAVTLDEGATSYTFEAINADHSVYVEYGAVETESPEKVEISVMVTNGVKTGGGLLRYGTASHTVTWAPSNGFQVKSVTVDNVPVPESMLQPNGGSYTFSNIVADHSVVVVCEKVESGESKKYYLEANIVNGLFDPDSMFGVYPDPAVRDGFEAGENFEISWAANEGYKVASVELDGVSRPDLVTAGKLSLIGIRSDHALRVVCIDEGEDPTVNEGPFTVTTAINHGTISPTFTTTETQNYYTVSWTADEAYEVVNVLVDGNPYANWADGYITFNPITANHTVDVYAQLKEPPKEDEYVIDIIVDNGGTHDVTVDGDSVTVVRKGSSAVASWQAAEGYDVSRIVIDGVSYTGLPGCTAQGGSYSFNNVSADHKIVVYTTKHVEKDPVYYGISVLPYGDPNNVDLIAEAGGQSGKSLVAVLDGSEATVRWNAKAGWKIDKVTRNETIMSDAEVAAGMSADGFKFTVNSNNNFVVYISEVKRADESFLTVTTQITNGTISSGCSVQKGENVEVSWLPNNGYEVTKVEITRELVDADGNVTTETETFTDLAGYSYALDNIQGNTTVSVSCEKAEEDVKHSYQISSEVTNGTVSGTGKVLAGESRMLVWMPAEGCTVSSVELYVVDDDGNIIREVDISDRNGNSFTIENVNANYLLVLVCENENRSDTDFFYDINTTISNGTINGPFLNLRKNGGALVEWMPNDGYHVKELLVDGVTKPIPADYSLEVLVEGEDHTVEVICEKDPPIIIRPDDDTRYVRTAIYDGSGEITPTTQVVVGSDFTVRWKPDENMHYKVDRVYVNGINIPTPANNMVTLNIEALKDENGEEKDYTVEVYLVENLVHVNVEYEGKGDVVKSGTVYYSEDFGIVQGIANVAEGYKLEKVYVNNVLLQPGEILTEYLPDPNQELPRPQNPGTTTFGAKARKVLNSVLDFFSLSADAADETNWDTPENRARCVDPVSGLQNTFYFRNVTSNQYVDYVFTDENGATDYAPYNVSVTFEGGRGEQDAARNVAPGATESIGWKLEDGFYIDHVSILRDGRETDITSVDDAVLSKDTASGKDIVTLSNIQATTVVKVYLNRGTAPTSNNDFSLAVDVVGPGSSDPAVKVDGAARGLAPGEHTAIWNVGEHRVTMVTVDGELRTDLIGKDRVTIAMSEEDASHDHKVVVYLDGEVMPNLTKSAGNTSAKVGSKVPYTITLSNDSDNAIWQNVALKDTIPEGLDIDKASIKLYKVAADGSKTEWPVSYDEASRLLSAEVGNLGRTDRFELSFTATVNENATAENIGNSVTAAGKLYGYEDEDVQATAGPVYPGGTAEVTPANPDPKITKTVVNADNTNQNTRVGDVLTYTIEVWNEKAGSLWKNVKLQDVLPNGLEYVDGSIEISMLSSGRALDVPAGVSAEYDRANNTITATLGDIDSVKHYQIVFKARVTMGALGADIGNVALAAGFTPERRAANVETEAVYPFEADKTGVLPKAPKPVIVKAASNLDRSGEISQVGDRLEYSLTVSNEESDTVWKNAVIRDRIPDGIDVDTASITLTTPDGTVTLDASVYDEASRLLSVYLGDIAGGEQYKISFAATLSKDPMEYDIGNYGWVNGKDPSLPGGNDPVPGVDENTKPGDPYFPPNGDDWVDNGSLPSNKVYPNGEGAPANPGAKAVKTATNLMHPKGDTEVGDVIEYQIEVTNTEPKSRWKNVSIVDTLPEELSPEETGFLLVYPDGTTETLRMEDHYDFQTHTITVALPKPVAYGESYYLRYRTIVNSSEYVPGVNDELINNVVASGTGLNGEVVEANASSSIFHPGAAYANMPGATVVKTAANLMRPIDLTSTYDTIEYQIEITNTEEKSRWKNVTVVDTLPEELSLDVEQDLVLVHPDGTTEALRMEDHYDARTHTITVVLPEPILYGESYFLRYRAVVNNTPYVPGVNDDIVNTVVATGTGPHNEIVEASATSRIIHPGAVGGGVRTGDESNVLVYTVVMVSSAALLAAVLVIGKRKAKKKED